MGEGFLTKEAIYKYVKEQYGTLPEHLWKKDPESAVLRHQNGKWYAVIMNVKKNVLGLQETGNVDIMNVKCDPEMTGLITQSYGYLPGYHMNKKHWISILLDRTVQITQVEKLLDESYQLVTKK